MSIALINNSFIFYTRNYYISRRRSGPQFSRIFVKTRYPPFVGPISIPRYPKLKPSPVINKLLKLSKKAL